MGTEKNILRKSVVTPEMGRNWLRRLEAGESVEAIHVNDKIDPRTIRKYIDIARRESEARETRTELVREALAQHFNDLCCIAQKLDEEITNNEAPITLRADRRFKALKQHMPRSPLWANLNKWDTVHEEISKTTKAVATRIRDAVRNLPEVTIVMEYNERITDAMVVALASQLASQATGSDLKCIENRVVRSGGEYILGPAALGTISSDDLRGIKDALSTVESLFYEWDEFEALVKLHRNVKELATKIDDQLAIITLRRVVSGRCTYCPI